MALPTNPNERRANSYRPADSGDDGTSRVAIEVEKEVQYSWKNVLTQAEFNVKESSGYLKGIVINTPLASGVISIYNNGSGASTSMGVITNPGTLLSDTSVRVDYDLAFSSGLTIVTSGANQDITVIYK